jgi:transitional endoplasmic reticulum ATPase
LATKPNIRFNDIAGLHEVKETIRRRILYPFTFPEITSRYKKKAGGGVLLYGPPGTGKTLMAKAVATELDAAFFSVKCSDIMSKWVGEAENNIRELFAEARKAVPSVIFFDETEALIGKRSTDSTVMKRVIPEFLTQVEGVENQKTSLLLLGATNLPWELDEAALRPGRFGELIYIGLPDADARQHILQTGLNGIPQASEIDIVEIVSLTEGYSGADLTGVLDKATDHPYARELSTRKIDQLTMDDIRKTLQMMQPSVSKQQLERYVKFRQTRR